jgi:prepilin-type N-terminal cleavage/methylation domain-containing protein
MRPPRGFSLPEILVAVGIGLVLVAAFLVVLQRCRTLYTASESLAQAQDAARHAMAVLVDDVQHAGFFGLAPADRVELVAGGAVMADRESMRQPDGTREVAAASGVPAGTHACGGNFAVDLSLPVEASDQGYRLGRDARNCAPTASADGASASADTLTVRHASLDLAAARAGRLQVYSHVLASLQPLRLFADGRPPGPRDGGEEIRDLEVRSYYVANSSVGRPGWPALRVKALTESGGAAQFRDEEIMPGVEDLQVELGIETQLDGIPGIEWLTPDSPRARREPLVAVRLWLRVRADHTESGYRDDRALAYSNSTFTPGGLEARQRRILVTRTVALRNRAP